MRWASKFTMFFRSQMVAFLRRLALCYFLCDWPSSGIRRLFWCDLELYSFEAELSFWMDSIIPFSPLLVSPSCLKPKERPSLYKEIDGEDPVAGRPSYRSGSRTGRVRRHTRRTPPMGRALTRMGKSPVMHPRESNGLNSMVTWRRERQRTERRRR